MEIRSGVADDILYCTVLGRWMFRDCRGESERVSPGLFAPWYSLRSRRDDHAIS
jgi:hypothetical protein